MWLGQLNILNFWELEFNWHDELHRPKEEIEFFSLTHKMTSNTQWTLKNILRSVKMFIIIWQRGHNLAFSWLYLYLVFNSWLREA